MGPLVEEPPPWWERVAASGSVLFVHGRRTRTRSALKRSQKSFRWLVGLNAAFEETGRRGLLERPWQLAMPDYSEHLAVAVARRPHDQDEVLPARLGLRNVAVRNMDRVHSEERYLSHPPVADAVVAALHGGIDT